MDRRDREHDRCSTAKGVGARVARTMAMDKPSVVGTQPIQHIYRRNSDSVERPLACAECEAELVRIPSIAATVCVTDIMTRDVSCARRDLEASIVVKLMVDNRIGCVPVVEEPGRPVVSAP